MLDESFSPSWVFLYGYKPFITTQAPKLFDSVSNNQILTTTEIVLNLDLSTSYDMNIYGDIEVTLGPTLPQNSLVKYTV